MRVGTWNVEGRWSAQHAQFLSDLNCDVWLLTEVHVDAGLPGFTMHRTTERMGQSKSWAAVATSRPAHPKPDPHFATAAAEVEGMLFLSSILPWRSCGPAWLGADLTEKMSAVVDAIRPALPQGPVVWGGDWNQALSGPEYVGTLRGRRLLLDTLEGNDLVVPTAIFESARRGHRSIDHVAVPDSAAVTQVRAVQATDGGRRLSDHDAYTVTFSL